MTKSAKNKIFKFNKKEQMSTLDLWQSHLQALKRASQERRAIGTDGKPVDGKPLDAGEITTSEFTVRPRH